ncbi:MAG TPA: MFS transporter [Bauldia sp.]|nr:MFS transporter [Bauldia sp.]
MPLALTYFVTLLLFSTIHASRVTLSLYTLQLGGTPSTVALLLTTFYAFPLVISWPVGVLSDRVGSRPLLLLGILFGVVGMTIPFFFRSLDSVFVGGVLVGLSFSFHNVLLQNLVGLLSTPELRARNLSNSFVIGSIAGFVGPLIAGVTIDHVGNALACLYVSVPPLTAFVALVVWGGRLPGGSLPAEAPVDFRSTLAQPGLIRVLVTSGISQFGQDLFALYIPVYGHLAGLSASTIGVVLASFAAATFLVRFTLARLIERLGIDRLLSYSLILTAAAALLVPVTANPVLLSMIAFVAGLGVGCCQPVTTIMMFRDSAAGRTGGALGLRLSVNNLVRAGGPIFLGLIASGFGFPPVFWTATAFILYGGWLAYPAAGRAPTDDAPVSR